LYQNPTWIFDSFDRTTLTLLVEKALGIFEMILKNSLRERFYPNDIIFDVR